MMCLDQVYMQLTHLTLVLTLDAMWCANFRDRLFLDVVVVFLGGGVVVNGGSNHERIAPNNSKRKRDKQYLLQSFHSHYA